MTTTLPAPPTRPRPRGHRGFSLLELIVTIVILAILAAIGIWLYGSHVDRARDAVLDQTLAAVDRSAETSASFDETTDRRNFLDAAAAGIAGTVTVHRDGDVLSAEGWNRCRQVTYTAPGGPSDPEDCGAVSDNPPHEDEDGGDPGDGDDGPGIPTGGGYVTMWGDGHPSMSDVAVPASIAARGDVVEVAAGQHHAVVRHADGTVSGFGFDAWNDGLATPPAGLSDVDVVAVAAGGGHSLAVTSTGRVHGWGDDTHGKATPPAGLSDVVAVAAGGHGDFSVALRSNGQVVMWGDPSFVDALPTGISNAVAIAAGGGHALGLLDDGTVISLTPGFNDSTPPVDLAGVVGIAAGGGHSLAWRSDGTVTAWGLTWGGAASPPADLRVTALSAGDGYTLAITAPDEDEDPPFSIPDDPSPSAIVQALFLDLASHLQSGGTLASYDVSWPASRSLHTAFVTGSASLDRIVVSGPAAGCLDITLSDFDQLAVTFPTGQATPGRC